MIRTQVFLTQDEVRLLSAAAHERGTSKSELIRQAVDKELNIKNDKSRLLRALAKSVGAFKGGGLKKRIDKARENW